ncbi:serine hydrolase [Flavitalea flava]
MLHFFGFILATGLLSGSNSPAVPTAPNFSAFTAGTASSVIPDVKAAPGDTAQLRKDILAEFAKQPTGTFAVAFKDLGTGETFFYNEHDNFHAASTMKTPVMIETYKQAAAHKFALTDSVIIHTNFLSIVDNSPYNLDSVQDSETALYRMAGTKLPISELLYRMITQSSNLATNLMIEIVGAKNVMKTMKSIGAKDIQVLRGVEDDKAFKLNMNNTTTSYDLMLVFERIAKGKIVSKTACESMIKILLDQHFTNKIAGKLPKEVKVASKSGSIDGICHDSGIVFLPDGRKYVVVLLSRGIASLDSAADTEANVSKILYDHVMGK